MRWPWVSRETLDELRRSHEERVADLRAEIRWLRDREAEMADQLVRIQRVRSGLRESGERPTQRMEPMPAELKKYIRSFANKAVQKQQSDVAFSRYRAGEEWSEILQSLQSEDQGREPWEGIA